MAECRDHRRRGRELHTERRTRRRPLPADHCHLNRRLTTRPDRGLDVHPTISELLSSILFGGRYGIRTHGDPEATTAFEAAPFVRSGNLPPQRLPALRLRHTAGPTRQYKLDEGPEGPSPRARANSALIPIRAARRSVVTVTMRKPAATRLGVKVPVEWIPAMTL